MDFTRKWTPEHLVDTVKLTWEGFQQKYPDFCTFPAYRRMQYDVKAGRVDRSSHVATAREMLDRIKSLQAHLETVIEEEEEEEEEEREEEKRSGFEVREDGNIFINYDTRTIVTNLGEFGTVVFAFDRHALMRRRYANDWEGSADTIPEIARDFDLHPKAFERYKAMHGWTHASDPFTDEEWAEGLSVDEAVNQTLESQRRAYHKKLQQEKWKKIIDDAEKWRRFEHSALQPMMASIQTYAPQYSPPSLQFKATSRTFDLVLCPYDVHYGKSGWSDETGAGYSRREAAEMVIEKTQSILDTVSLYGTPRKIITAVGSDWYHVDTDSGTTTSGTPQDLDGTPAAVLWEGSELAIAQIDMLRQVAPVDVYYVAGNHDRMLGWGLLYAVYAWFHKQHDITIHNSPAPRQYAVSGNTLLGFTHGDGAKATDLPLLMATEAASYWGRTKYRAWFTGHLHHELTRDTLGVVQFQLPSLSGSDRWHTRNGYVGSRRALAAYVVDETQGVTASLYAPR
jgi:hypothetical protein